MSEKTNNSGSDIPSFVKAAPELLPVWDWWVKEGRSTLLMLAVAAIAIGGFYAGRNWLHSRDAAANAALVNAFTTDELESAVADYGSTKIGESLRLRLAKSYYDGGRYQDALESYDALVAKMAAGGPFTDIAKIGRAYSLEGLKKFAEAQKAFADYAADEANAESYLLLTARLGAARCKALAGDKDAALKDFDALKAKAQDEIAKTRIERMADAVRRHDPKRAARSLFDAANSAAASLEKSAKAAETAKPAEAAKKPEAKPAPVAKAEAKPAEAAKKPEAAKPADVKKPEAKPAEAKK